MIADAFSAVFRGLGFRQISQQTFSERLKN